MGNLFDKALKPYLIPQKTAGGYAIKETTDLTWPELRTVLTNAKVRTALFFMPPEQFLELPFLYTCNELDISAVMGSPFNLAWVLEALKVTDCDCIVTTDKIASYLFETMKIEPSYTVPTIVFVGSENQHTTRTLPSVPKNCDFHRIAPFSL